MPYRFIGRDPNNGGLRGFEEFFFGGKWIVKTESVTEPLAYRLANGFLFRAHERYGDEVAGEPVPPIPVSDPVTMPNDFDAYISEKRYENWSITTAYQWAKNPAHDSAEIDAKCQRDSGFREALDASAGIEHLIPAPPVETTAKAEQPYKTLSQLTSSQTDYINRKTRVGGWGLEKSFSLISSRNGLFKDNGSFAVFGGYLVAECRECHRKAKYPLSGWVNGECQCDCGAGDNYSENGAKLE